MEGIEFSLLNFGQQILGDTKKWQLGILLRKLLVIAANLPGKNESISDDI